MRKFFSFALIVLTMLGELAGCGLKTPETEDVSAETFETDTKKSVITLGVLDENREAYRLAELFNDENSDYSIEIIELTRFNYMDEVSGDHGQASALTPDLLWCAGLLDYYQYKAHCVELSRFIERDDVISKESFVHGILGSGYNGQVYSIPLDFSIDAYFTKLTYASGNNYLFDLAACDRDVLFDRLTSYAVSNFLSSENISFSEMGFENIINMGLNSADKSLSKEEASFMYYLPIQKNFGTIQSARILTDGNYSLCGIPSSNSNGCMYQVDTEICMTNYCRDKDGAWEFIRFLLAPERQMDMAGLPVISACFDKQVEEALSSGALKPEDAEKLKSLISETEIVQHSSGDYKSEIEQMFFYCVNGWKTPEEATDKLDEYFC